MAMIRKDFLKNFWTLKIETEIPSGQNAVGSERCVAIKAACATELGQHQNSDPNSTVKSEFEAIAEAPTLVTYKLSKAEMKRKPARHGGNNIMLMFRVP